MHACFSTPVNLVNALKLQKNCSGTESEVAGYIDREDARFFFFFWLRRTKESRLSWSQIHHYMPNSSPPIRLSEWITLNLEAKACAIVKGATCSMQIGGIFNICMALDYTHYIRRPRQGWAGRFRTGRPHADRPSETLR